MKKLLTIFFIIFPAIAIANQINIDKAYKLARDSIEKNKLTKLKQECLSLVEKKQNNPTYYEIDIREIHNDKCGGDPNTAPRLMTYRVNKQDGTLQSDAFELAERHNETWSGKFYSIK